MRLRRLFGVLSESAHSEQASRLDTRRAPAKMRAGFADMRFAVDAVPSERFAQWVAQTQNTGSALDAKAYADLAKPSKAVTPFTYRAVAPNLFDGIVNAEMAANDSPLRICSTSQRAEQ